MATGLICSGAEVHATGHEYSRMVRWHDLEGRALKTSLQTNMAEDFSLPATGDPYSVSSTGSWHKHYDYPVPGDGDARILIETGAMTRLAARGQGVIFQDTGLVTYAPSHEYEEPVVSHGAHHDRFGDTAFDDAICEALS